MSTNQKLALASVAVAAAGVVGGLAKTFVVDRPQAEGGIEVAEESTACDNANRAEVFADESRTAFFVVLENRRKRGAPVTDAKIEAAEEVDRRYRAGRRHLSAQECKDASAEFAKALQVAQDACPLSYDPECSSVSNIQPD